MKNLFLYFFILLGTTFVAENSPIFGEICCTGIPGFNRCMDKCLEHDCDKPPPYCKRYCRTNCASGFICDKGC